MTRPATVWITGARGFIGRHLAARLAGAGQSAVGIGHGAWPAADAAQHGVTRWVNGDISSSNLHALGHDCGLPSVVYHLAGGSSVGAAIANPLEDFSRTVVSTSSLLEWLRQVSPETKLVVASSAAVYGTGHSGPIDEEAPGRPHSPYGYHKHMMEQLCRSYGTSFQLHSVVPRFFSVYGPGLRKQLLWDLCCKLQNSSSIVELGGTGDELRDWTEVSDVVAALVAAPALASVASPVLNVGTGIATPVRRIAAMVLDAWHPRRSQDDLRFNGIARPGDPISLQADTRKMTTHGMTCAVRLEEGISRYVRWYQALVLITS
jgi:UDP-glucose 4-epimerase